MMWRDARSGADGPRGVARLVGESGPMRELKALIPRVATSPFPVVIDGETGTGKELIARALHEEGPRRGAVFFSVEDATVFHSRGVARPWPVTIDSTIVSCRSAAKLVQSSATTTSVRAPTMNGVQ